MDIHEIRRLAKYVSGGIKHYSNGGGPLDPNYDTEEKIARAYRSNQITQAEADAYQKAINDAEMAELTKMSGTGSDLEKYLGYGVPKGFEKSDTRSFIKEPTAMVVRGGDDSESRTQKDYSVFGQSRVGYDPMDPSNLSGLSDYEIALIRDDRKRFGVTIPTTGAEAKRFGDYSRGLSTEFYKRGEPTYDSDPNSPTFGQMVYTSGVSNNAYGGIFANGGFGGPDIPAIYAAIDAMTRETRHYDPDSGKWVTKTTLKDSPELKRFQEREEWMRQNVPEGYSVLWNEEKGKYEIVKGRGLFDESIRESYKFANGGSPSMDDPTFFGDLFGKYQSWRGRRRDEKMNQGSNPMIDNRGRLLSYDDPNALNQEGAPYEGPMYPSPETLTEAFNRGEIDQMTYAKEWDKWKEDDYKTQYQPQGTPLFGSIEELESARESGMIDDWNYRLEYEKFSPEDYDKFNQSKEDTENKFSQALSMFGNMPTMGLPLDSKLIRTGYLFGSGKGKTGKGLASAGSSLLDLTRNVMTGVGHAKRDKQIMDQYRADMKRVQYSPVGQSQYGTTGDTGQAAYGGMFGGGGMSTYPDGGMPNDMNMMGGMMGADLKSDPRFQPGQYIEFEYGGTVHKGIIESFDGESLTLK